jgi:hypothetical protein
MARVGASEPLNAPFGTGARPEASCRRSRSIQRGKRRFAATQIDSIVRVRLLSCSAALEMRSRRESTSQGDDPLDRIGRSDNVSMRRSSIELVARRALEVASCTRRLSLAHGKSFDHVRSIEVRTRLLRLQPQTSCLPARRRHARVSAEWMFDRRRRTGDVSVLARACRERGLREPVRALSGDGGLSRCDRELNVQDRSHRADSNPAKRGNMSRSGTTRRDKVSSRARQRLPTARDFEQRRCVYQGRSLSVRRRDECRTCE